MKIAIYSGYSMSDSFSFFLSGVKRFISKHATLLYHQKGEMNKCVITKNGVKGVFMAG